jgi:hypothetical protein
MNADNNNADNKGGFYDSICNCTICDHKTVDIASNLIDAKKLTILRLWMELKDLN